MKATQKKVRSAVKALECVYRNIKVTDETTCKPKFSDDEAVRRRNCT